MRDWFGSCLLAAGTFHVRAKSWQEQEELCHHDPKEWIADLSEAEIIEDDVDRKIEVLRLKFPAVSVGRNTHKFSSAFSFIRVIAGRL